MPDPFAVQPHLSVLSPDQIEWIHQKSLLILSQTGLRVDSQVARQVFARGGDSARIQEDRLYLDSELVDWAIQNTPHTIQVFDRLGQPAFLLGSGEIRFGVGVTNLYFQDPLSDQVEPFTRDLLGRCVRLGDALSSFDLVSTIGILSDLPPSSADLYAVLEMVANTIKPLVVLVSDEQLFVPALDMLESRFGDLGLKPFILPYFNPVTPLVINQGTAEKTLEAVKRGLPLIYSNYGMAGLSTPITPTGTLALLNAELLAGLVLIQLARPGAPVILGSLPAFFDMKSMQEFYDPYTVLLNLACAEMMAQYRIPHAGTSGSGDGWGVDLLGGGLHWMNHLTGLLGRVCLAPFVGGNLNSKVFSPAMTVYADEVIGMARQFARGFHLDDEALGMDEILAAGPGGSFLTSPLTLKRFRSAYYQSRLFPRLSLDKWQAESRPLADQFIRLKAQELLNSHPPPADHDDIVASAEEWIRSWLKKTKMDLPAM